MIEQPPSSAEGATLLELVPGARHAPRVGEAIGSYRLVRLIGAGTGGCVFEVVHEKLGRRAALKLLGAAQAARPAARARFFA